MASMTYKALANPMFVAPQFVAFLESLPDNYLPVDPAVIESVTPGAPEEVKAYLLETLTGPLLTTQLWQMIDGLPFFDPGVAQVPGLVISGDAESGDGGALAADYGASGARFSEIGGGHAPRLESTETALAFWGRVFEFIDSPIP